MQKYRISVEREFDQYLKGWFDDCSIEISGGVTRIYCSLSGQEELYGMLQRIQSLGLPLAEAVKIIDQEN